MRKQDIKKYIKEELSKILEKKGKDQDGDSDKDFADVMIARMMAAGKSKEDAIKATKNKSYNKESLSELNIEMLENYMFFGNLKQMKRQIEIMLEMDPRMVDQILQTGHDWADDHISEAKQNVDQVFDFFMNKFK